MAHAQSPVMSERAHFGPRGRAHDHRRAGRRPSAGQRIETEVVEGRPPSTIDVPTDGDSACRYCLAEWVQSGPSAVYTFLYHL